MRCALHRWLAAVRQLMCGRSTDPLYDALDLIIGPACAVALGVLPWIVAVRAYL